jgi:hypothetical protein
VCEAGLHLLWVHQLRGLFTVGKLVLLAAVPWYWEQRVALLTTVVVIGSVGSHMPARFRYWSILEQRVVRTGSGPGAQADNDSENAR